MRFEIRHLRAFSIVAEELHFNRAAERLNTAQPNLSRTIRALEEAVGTPLLKRTTRQVELTEAGRAFLVECRLGLGHLERAVTVAQRTADGETGELRIAYMDFAIHGRLPELLREFRKVHPDIRLQLNFLSSEQQKEALLEHKIDIGFLIGGFENGGICNHQFDKEPYVAVLPATHRLAGERSVRLADLAKEPFVLGSNGTWNAYRRRLFILCHQAGFFPDIVQEASSSEGIFGLVSAGAGISIYANCARDVQRRGVVILPLEDVSDMIPTCAAWDAGSSSPTLARFTDFMIKYETYETNEEPGD